MKYCSQCGSELRNGQSFCNKCGHKLSPIKENEKDKEKKINLNKNIDENSDENINDDLCKSTNDNINNTQDVVVDLPTQNNFVLSKKMKIGIMSSCVIVVLTIIFFKLGYSFTQPSKVVSNFQKAISSGDKKELINLLYCNDNRLEINEKTIDPLLSYFKENPSYLTIVTKDLNKEAINISITKNLYDQNRNDSQDMLSIVSVGKKFIFFPNYKIGIKSSFIQINASIKDASFSLNDINLGKSDTDNFSKEFGPFIPGKYNLIANYKGKYISLNESYAVDFFNKEDIVPGKEIINALTNTNYVIIESEYSDAKIFVDGKDSGAKVADAKNFGPLSSGTKVYAIVTENGKQLKSQEYIVQPEDNNIYLSFEEAINAINYLESDLKQLIYNYTYNFADAVNYNDFSRVAPYLYPSSKLYNEQAKYIPATYNNGIKEYLSSSNMISYNLNSDNKSGTINTQEIYSIDNKGVTSVKTFKYTYTVKYNEDTGSYQLDSISIS
ncbi:zinc ribbon domain-containing protein [Clostridium sp.]|uniref:zinc ribbon domain-containing protein n=1 Tax=Clostridium sp. TaxID=1506 RepID=UPI003D6D514B